MQKIIASILIFAFSLQLQSNVALASKPTSQIPGGVFQANYFDSNYVVGPLVGMAMGFKQAGRRGAAFGFFLGCIDEALIQSGLTQKHYLTAGLLGAVATSSINHRWAPCLGFAGGSFAASGYLCPVLEHAAIPATSTLIAASQGGSKAGIAAAICGAIDETLLTFEIVKKPFLSNSVYGIALTHALTPHLLSLGARLPFARNLIPIAAASGLPFEQITCFVVAAAMSFGEPMYKAKSPLQLKEELYNILLRIIDEDQLILLMERQAIVLVAFELTLAGMGLSLSKHFQSLDTSLVALGTATQSDMRGAQADFNRAVARMVVFFPFNFATKTASDYVNSLLSDQAARRVKDIMFERFSNDETPMRLASDKNSTALVEKMDEYLDTLLTGTKVLGGALQSGAGGLFYISFLHRANSLDLLVLLDVYNQAFAIPNVWLSRWISSFEESYAQVQSIENNLAKDVLKQSELVVPGDKMSLIKSKIMAARQEKRKLDDKLLILSGFQSGYRHVGHVLGYLAKTYLIGRKLIAKELAYADAQPAMQAVTGVSEAMSWQGSNAQAIEKIEVATKLLHRLLDKFEEKKNPDLIANYKTMAAEDIGIRFENLLVGVEDTNLVHIPEMFLPKGIYAVTGPQGSGKSAWLSKVKGTEENLFWARGDISYLTKNGNMPKRVLVTQKDYMAPFASLLEVIMSKPKSEFNVEETAIHVASLLREIGFDATNDDAKVEKWLLEEQPDWSMLSGGQRKTINVVSAIMAKPDLLILDEVFAGMDKQAVANAQKVIKRELPSSLIFVVDHHAHDNNADGFYDKELYLANKQLHIKDLKPNH